MDCPAGNREVRVCTPLIRSNSPASASPCGARGSWSTITRIGPQSTGIMRVGPQSTGSRESDHGPRGQVHGVTRVRPWATGSRSTGSRGLGHGPRGHESRPQSTVITGVRPRSTGQSEGQAMGHRVTPSTGSRGWATVHGGHEGPCDCSGSACRLAYCNWRSSENQSHEGSVEGGDTQLAGRLDTALHARSQQSGQPPSLLASASLSEGAAWMSASQVLSAGLSPGPPGPLWAVSPRGRG